MKRITQVRALALGTVLFFGCSSGDTEQVPSGPRPYGWSPIGPDGGFVSSVAFDPSLPGRVWASGDDSSGLYLSTNDGATWRPQTSAPRDHCSYSIVIDPFDSQRIYAPNEFGRGLLMTNDGGLSWRVTGDGLPTFGAGSRFPDLALDATSSATVIACTASGLFRSLDFGENFTQVTSATFGSDSEFTAAVSSGDGLFVGSSTGRVYRSVDAGVTWIEVTTSAFVGVTDLALTDHALYVAFAEGTLVKTATFTSAGLTVLNSGGGAGTIDSGLWTKLAAASGSSMATDILYVGTVFKEASHQWGFHASFDGGATFKRRIAGLDGASVFSIAVDPLDSSHLIVGTVGQGVFVTTDAGQAWAPSSSGISAMAALAVAIDPTDISHRLISSTESLDGTDGVFETFDDGATWDVVDSLPSDASALHLVPTNPEIVLVGSFNESTGPRPGILRSTTGSAGPWASALQAAVQVDRFVRTDTAIFAVAPYFFAPSTQGDVGLYASIDDGASWELRFNGLVLNLAEHGDDAEHLVVVGEDAWATLDGLATAPTSLGLSAFAPGEIFTSVAFVSNSRILVGSNQGRLYSAVNYDPTGTGMTWEELVTPAQDVLVRDILVEGADWWLACFTGDLLVQANSTPGVLRSSNGGQTWSFLENGLLSSRLVWSLQRHPSESTRFVASMWGGGALELAACCE